MFSAASNLINKKRAAFPPQNADMLLFLKANKYLLQWWKGFFLIARPPSGETLFSPFFKIKLNKALLSVIFLTACVFCLLQVLKFLAVVF